MNKPHIVIYFLIVSLFFNFCKKDDTTPPVITLKGKSTVILSLGDTYIDEGATAEDNKDGNITNKIVVSGVPTDTYHAGEYIITYNAEDALSNTALQVSRIIHIKTDKLKGQYVVEETNDADATSSIYTITVTQSDTTYNKLFISNFRNKGDSVKINALIYRVNYKDTKKDSIYKKDTIDIPFQFINKTVAQDTIVGLGGTYDGSPDKLQLNTLKYSLKGKENGAYLNKNYFITIKSKVAAGKKN